MRIPSSPKGPRHLRLTTMGMRAEIRKMASGPVEFMVENTRNCMGAGLPSEIILAPYIHMRSQGGR
ncbi:hypothetical protein D3C81_1664410 [compost metagenome]